MKAIFNSRSILGVIFGIFIASSTSVISAEKNDSNADKMVEVLGKALERALYNQQQLEDRRFDSLPDVIECEKLEWMKSCDVINREAKKNPNAPLRIISKDGIEFNFVPGMSSQAIRLQLERTPEAAEEYIRSMGKTMGAYKEVASVYTEQLSVMGGMDNVRTIDQMRIDDLDVPVIDYSAVAMSIFIESNCSACDILMNNVKTFSKRHPKAKFNVYMVNNDPKAFKEKVLSKGFAGRILKPSETLKVIEKGSTGWPVIWLDNGSQRSRDILLGVSTSKMIENRLLSISKLKTSL
jgi:hypothetical protein